MESQNNRPPSEQPRPAEPPAPKKRFQIVKLEERLAPKHGHGGQSSASSGVGSSASFY
jgi:hypothetical protein